MSIALADRSPLFVLQKQAAGLIVSQVCRNFETYSAMPLLRDTRFEKFLTAKNVRFTWYRLSNMTFYSFHTLSTIFFPVYQT